MVKYEWHNYLHGCNREAKHVCRSLVRESVSILPAHRAFCDECFDRIHQQKSVGINIDEISYEEWTAIKEVK